MKRSLGSFHELCSQYQPIYNDCPEKQQQHTHKGELEARERIQQQKHSALTSAQT
jgi:hypothetical protein